MKNIFYILFLMLLSSAASASQTVDPTGGASAVAASQPEQFQSCAHADYLIRNRCMGNPDYINYQANSKRWSQLSQGAKTTGASKELEQGKGEIQTAQTKIAQILKTCMEAQRSCSQVCEREYTEAASKNPQQTEKMNQANKTNEKCIKEAKEMNESTKVAQADLNSVLQTILAALEMLKGLGGDGGADVATASLTDPEDPCDKYGDILVGECGSAPTTGSRSSAGLTGVGGTGAGQLNSDGLVQSAAQGEPGGESKKPSKGSGFNAAGGGGFGGFGSFGSAGAGNSNAGAGEDKALNTDIHKGFMGAGAGGGGGGFSGGGGAPRAKAAPFAKYGLGSGGGDSQKAALQKKLSKYAKGSKRGLASSGGTNGPFQDNWSVVKKAYKKNSTTMYHQK